MSTGHSRDVERTYIDIEMVRPHKLGIKSLLRRCIYGGEILYRSAVIRILCIQHFEVLIMFMSAGGFFLRGKYVSLFSTSFLILHFVTLKLKGEFS